MRGLPGTSGRFGWNVTVEYLMKRPEHPTKLSIFVCRLFLIGKSSYTYFQGDNKESPGADADGGLWQSLGGDSGGERRRRLRYHVTWDSFRLLILLLRFSNWHFATGVACILFFSNALMLLVSLLLSLILYFFYILLLLHLRVQKLLGGLTALFLMQILYVHIKIFLMKRGEPL